MYRHDPRWLLWILIATSSFRYGRTKYSPGPARFGSHFWSRKTAHVRRSTSLQKWKKSTAHQRLMDLAPFHASIYVPEKRVSRAPWQGSSTRCLSCSFWTPTITQRSAVYFTVYTKFSKQYTVFSSTQSSADHCSYRKTSNFTDFNFSSSRNRSNRHPHQDASSESIQYWRTNQLYGNASPPQYQNPRASSSAHTRKCIKRKSS